MKKTSISIDMEAEKLRALRFYTEKKETKSMFRLRPVNISRAWRNLLNLHAPAPNASPALRSIRPLR